AADTMGLEDAALATTTTGAARRSEGAEAERIVIRSWRAKSRRCGMGSAIRAGSSSLRKRVDTAVVSEPRRRRNAAAEKPPKRSFSTRYGGESAGRAGSAFAATRIAAAPAK